MDKSLSYCFVKVIKSMSTMSLRNLTDLSLLWAIGTCLYSNFPPFFYTNKICVCKPFSQSPLTSPEHQDFNNSRLKKLLEAEQDSNSENTNPFIKQRLKENVVTMNKMSELRTQLENLSMMKKNKKRMHGKKSKNPRRGSQNPSRQSRWSASTKNSLPLPPITSKTTRQVWLYTALHILLDG